jgi:hypothetical protein
VIERADLIVFAPAPPVFEFLGSVCDRLPADRDIHSNTFLIDLIKSSPLLRSLQSSVASSTKIREARATFN